MNQYPAWKNLLVVMLIAIGILYALPNIYGDDPAVQIKPRGDKEVTVEALAKVEDILNSGGWDTKSISMDESKILVKFRDLDTQALAVERIRREMEKQFIVAINLVPATPSWLASLGASPMVLGLDLQGGIHILLEVDMPTAIAHQMELYKADVRRLMRDDGIRYVGVNVEGNGLRILFRKADSRAAALSKFSSEIPELLISEREESGKPSLFATLKPSKISEIEQTALQQNLTTLRNRVNELGVAEPIVQQQGADRIVVQLPGVQDPTIVQDMLTATATLEYRAVDQKNDPVAAERTGRIPAGSKLYYDRDGQPILLKRRLIVTGNQLIDATQGFDPQDGRPQVSVTLNKIGGERMKAFTLDNVGNRMAVVFVETKTVTRKDREGKPIRGADGKVLKDRTTKQEVISDAVIQGVFSNRFRTTGLDRKGEAQKLALLLRAGALAAPVEMIEERTVGPSLGKDSIEQGFESVLIGFVAVLFLMLLYYRVFGLIANLALFFNLVLTVALLSLLGATLTLPGIAGIVLTVGMAVDANVLIFERIREELRNGNSPQASIKAGYEKAFSTIADANVTTLLAAVVLFGLGTGPIKGFAITLTLGIITSMFTAIMGTRAVVNLVYGRKNRLKSLTI